MTSHGFCVSNSNSNLCEKNKSPVTFRNYPKSTEKSQKNALRGTKGNSDLRAFLFTGQKMIVALEAQMQPLEAACTCLQNVEGREAYSR